MVDIIHYHRYMSIYKDKVDLPKEFESLFKLLDLAHQSEIRNSRSINCAACC